MTQPTQPSRSSFHTATRIDNGNASKGTVARIRGRARVCARHRPARRGEAMSRSASRPASGGSRWREFGEARAYVRTQRLGSRSEWDAWLKKGERPPDIPANPYAIYKNSGWVSWGDWLGTGAISPRDRVYRPFEAARVFVRALRLGGVDDWYM